MVLTAESLVAQAEVTSFPGAKIVTQFPWLEKEARRSVLSEAATVIAVVAEAGERVQASPFSLPAATTIINPCWVAESIAEFMAADLAPPRDILPNAGLR
jgi:hypothetical protein